MLIANLFLLLGKDLQENQINLTRNTLNNGLPMFLNHAITEASFALPHNVVNVSFATTLQQRIKTSSAFGEKRQSPSLRAGSIANYRSKRALNKSINLTVNFNRLSAGFRAASYFNRYALKENEKNHDYRHR